MREARGQKQGAPVRRRRFPRIAGADARAQHPAARRQRAPTRNSSTFPAGQRLSRDYPVENARRVHRADRAASARHDSQRLCPASFDGYAALALAKKRCENPVHFRHRHDGRVKSRSNVKSGATDYVLKTRLATLGRRAPGVAREADRRERQRAEDQSCAARSTSCAHSRVICSSAGGGAHAHRPRSS